MTIPKKATDIILDWLMVMGIIALPVNAFYPFLSQPFVLLYLLAIATVATGILAAICKQSPHLFSITWYRTSQLICGVIVGVLVP